MAESKGSRRRKGGGRSRGRSGGGQQQQGRKRPQAAAAPKKGKAHSTPYTVPSEGPIAPFDLFCACHLGLMPDGAFRGAGVGEVARRLNRSQNEIRQMLADYKMDPESLAQVDFDLSLAKLDMQVAPEGIDRRELARGLYDEFLEFHDALADIEQRYQAGEVVTTAAPAPAANAAEEEPSASGRGRGRGRGRRGARSRSSAAEGQSGDSDPDPGADDDMDDADAVLEAELIADEGDLVTAEVGHSESKPARRVRRSPTRRGSGADG